VATPVGTGGRKRICGEALPPNLRRATGSPNTQAADLGRKGTADFHRQLVKGDLASAYENDIRVWLEPLG
jgi:serine/threonine-protein kinase